MPRKQISTHKRIQTDEHIQIYADTIHTNTHVYYTNGIQIWTTTDMDTHRKVPQTNTETQIYRGTRLNTHITKALTDRHLCTH